MSAFSHLQNELSACAIGLHASELHGLLIGYLCAAGDAGPADRRTIHAGWVGGEVPDAIHALLNEAGARALKNLGEFADFDFLPLLPDDETPIPERVRAAALWCSGFLAGYGEAGRPGGLSEDVQEVMQDMSRIAALSEDVPESEENESDLFRIVEFMRVGALLVFADAAAPARPGPGH